MTKTIPTLILKDVRMSWVAALRFSPYEGKTRAPKKAQFSSPLLSMLLKNIILTIDSISH
jgi:hypothetical protein